MMGIRRNHLKSERGEGGLIVMIFIVVVGVVWFLCYSTWHWIYDTKEARVERERGRVMRSHQFVVSDQEREPGGYQVVFNK